MKLLSVTVTFFIALMAYLFHGKIGLSILLTIYKIKCPIMNMFLIIYIQLLLLNLALTIGSIYCQTSFIGLETTAVKKDGFLDQKLAIIIFIRI